MFLMPLTDQPQLNPNLTVPPSIPCRPSGKDALKELLDGNRLTAHFQPIVSLQQARVFAYEALNRFNDNPELVCLPVLRGDRLCGLLNRHRFMETHMVGRFGYGLSLNYY